MNDFTLELENAIYQAISQDPFISAAVTGVFWGAAPESANYPGIVLDMVHADESEGRTLGNNQLDIEYLYSFTAYADGPNARASVLAIMKLVHAVMNDWRGDDNVDVYDCKRESFGSPRNISYSSGLVVYGAVAMYEMQVRT